MRSLSTAIIVIILLVSLTHLSAADGVDLFRIRVLNRPGGYIQVSADSGKTYTRVGKVTRAATDSAEGFLACKYAEPGTVAATAVHGLRIKVGGDISGGRYDNRIVSILPHEFDATPKGYGGHVAGVSGIGTDIAAGSGIFRNLAPFAGNPVYLERWGALAPLPANYTPRIDDVLVILVQAAADYPNEIIFENRQNGSVEALYDDHREKIALVSRPVTGIGRFDATGYTGTGAINTNHAGVITVSTAPLNGGEMGPSKSETRGGFQIVPFRHAKTLDVSPQIMVVCPLEDSKLELEGTSPLFRGCIGLAFDETDERMRYSADMRTDTSDWCPLPALTGKKDDAFSLLTISGKPVAYFRLRLPKFSRTWISAQIERTAKNYLQVCRDRAIRNGTTVSDSILSITMDRLDGGNASYVDLYVDGEFRGVSNSPPYEFVLQAKNLFPGEHFAELTAIGEDGRRLRSSSKTFFIN